MARVKQTIREVAAEKPAKKTRAATKAAESAEPVKAAKPAKTAAPEKPAKPAKPAKAARAEKAKQPEEAPAKPKARKEAQPGGVVRKRRFKPGTVAKREAQRLRKIASTTLVLQRGPFRDLVRAAFGDEVPPVTAEAMRAMQSIVEGEVMRVLELAGVLLKNGKRATLTAADVDCAIALSRGAQSFLHNY